jgi:hypothetical protein
VGYVPTILLSDKGRGSRSRIGIEEQEQHHQEQQQHHHASGNQAPLCINALSNMQENHLALA